MSSFSRTPLRLDLAKEAKCCASCVSCSQDRIQLDGSDLALLKTSAEKILQVKESAYTSIRIADMMPIVAIVKHIGKRKVFCRQERTWIHFWEPACSLWRPRTENEPSDRMRPSV